MQLFQRRQKVYTFWSRLSEVARLHSHFPYLFFRSKRREIDILVFHQKSLLATLSAYWNQDWKQLRNGLILSKSTLPLGNPIFDTGNLELLQIRSSSQKASGFFSIRRLLGFREVVELFAERKAIQPNAWAASFQSNLEQIRTKILNFRKDKSRTLVATCLRPLPLLYPKSPLNQKILNALLAWKPTNLCSKCIVNGKTSNLENLTHIVSTSLHGPNTGIGPLHYAKSPLKGMSALLDQ